MREVSQREQKEKNNCLDAQQWLCKKLYLVNYTFDTGVQKRLRYWFNGTICEVRLSDNPHKNSLISQYNKYAAFISTSRQDHVSQ